MGPRAAHFRGARARLSEVGYAKNVVGHCGIATLEELQLGFVFALLLFPFFFSFPLTHLEKSSWTVRKKKKELLASAIELADVCPPLI